MAVVEAAGRHQNLLDELLADVTAYKAGADTELVASAFAFAAEHHEGQQRRSGEDFINHPFGVAKICAELHLDEQTIAAALLHDVVEDTDVEIEEIRAEFGDDIALIVEGVTKLTRVQFASREQAEAENYRKLILAMAQDMRVILIKLADRLHNLRTIEYLGRQKQLQKSREALEVYAPLAHRLGIHTLKWELEDLAFQTLHPRKYDEIKAMVSERRADRDEHVKEAALLLQAELDKVDIPAEISGRPKHFYSIYEKMAKRGKEFNEIYDLTAMRVIVERSDEEGTRDCYGALGLIHSLWKPMPNRFKDYIAMPKLNGYRALHTTVIGPHGRPLEIQIRTLEMHRTAEFGIAAHWLYKAGDPRQKALDEWTRWVRQLIDWEQDEPDPQEFMKTVAKDLFDEEVFVFTPKYEVKRLPAGATPIDFAYAVHTDVGHRTVGAKVNGRIVPLSYQLHSGDRVEVLTSKSGRGPSRDWISLAASSRARNKIRQWFSRETREDSEARGREIARAGAAQAEPALPQAGRLRRACAGHPRERLQEGGGLLPRARLREAAAVADRQQAAPAAEDAGGRRGGAGAAEGAEGEARGRLEQPRHPRRGLRRRPRPARQVLHACTRRRPSSATSRSARASPSTAATVPNVKALQRNPERFTPVEWDGAATQSFRVQIAVDAWDRPRLLEDVARTFAEYGANIVEYGGHVEDQLAKNWYTAEIGDVRSLRSLLNALRHLEAVFDANRVTPSS